MKSRTTLILFFVALVVGGLVALDHYQGTSTDDARKRSKRVLNFESKDITGLQIDFTNHVYTLEKAGDFWQIKQPLRARANYSAVSSILDELEFVERARAIPEKEFKGMSLGDFGLQTPRIRLTLQGKRKPIVLLVGNETPTKDAVYVQVQGEKNVVVAPKFIYERLNRTLDDLRDRLVIDFQAAAATRIEIRSADHAIELVKSGGSTNAESRWALTRPLAARADQRKVGELLADLSGVQVTDFVSDDPKDLHTYQLDEPEREVTVWTGESGKTVLLGRAPTNDASKVYAKLRSTDSIYTVPSSVAQKLAVQANDLRDPRVLAFSEDSVRGIDLLHGTDRISLVHTDTAWKITTPLAVAADEAAVRRLLGHLSGLSVRQFTADVATDLDKYGLAAPMATVSLRGLGSNAVAQLLVGALDASNTVRFVKRPDEPFVYGVDTNIVSWLPGNYLALRSRFVADVKADEITRLVIEKKTGKVVLQRGMDKKWKLVEPAEGVLDNDALQYALEEFAALRAEDFIREGRDNLAEYGLEEPEVTISATAGDKTHTLALGKLQGPERKYALWSDPPLVFTVGTSAANTLTKDVVTPPSPPPASVSTNNPPPTGAPVPTNAPAKQ